MVVDILNNDSLFRNLILGLLLSLIISFISYKFKLLNKSGRIAIFFLALLIFGFGYWKWTLPIFIFFLFSSILSVYRKRKNSEVELYFEKSSQRDYLQVLANGGIGGILVIINFFYPSELIYIIYISIIASAAADTWATEIGTMGKTKTYNIITFKIVEQGLSGGISFRGLAGALLGAFIIALSSLIWININHLSYIAFVMFAGLFGSLIDSLFGAAVQAQFKCRVCSRVTEKKIHCKEPAQLYRGIKWVNNDAVNLTSGLAGGVMGFILFRSFLGIK